MLRFGDFTLDPVAFELRRAGTPVLLQRRVFDLIAYLATHADRLVGKDELLEHVWGGVAVSEASLAQAVKHARRALDDDADSPRFILTVRGRGYRFAGAVTSSEAAAPLPSPVPPRAGLVGRDTALRLLDNALADTLAGRGGVVLISGEPGIGKTRLLDEVATTARAAGARTVFARCGGGDAGAPLLWPWIQVLRLGAELDPEGVARLAREHAGTVPDLAPGSAPDRVAPDPLRARFHLFDAITRWLLRAATTAPVVVLLDDLHLADEPSLLLLRLLAGSIREARALVVSAHRSLGAGERGALVEILGGLAREGACRPLLLDGLGEEDVGKVLELGLGARPPAAVVRAVHAQTGGNPFFVTQVVHAAAARGGLPSEAELTALVLRSPAAEAIRAHLEILSPACRELLSAAAVAGAAFDAQALGAALDLPAAEVMTRLAEAVDGGIVAADERRAGRHRFVHALVRDALHAAIALPQRVRLHARFGAALVAQERAGASPDLSEIAYHLLSAAPAGDAAEAASYAVRAAEEEAAKGAHEDAVRCYEWALQAIDLGPPDPMRRVEVMLALGTARYRAGDLARSKEVFQQSGNVARALGAGDKLADAALGFALEDERSTADRRRIAFLEEGLRAITGGSAARRAVLSGRLAVAQYFSADRAAREKLAREAVSAARGSGDPAALAFALRCLHFVLLAPDTAEERLSVSGELCTLCARIDDCEAELYALGCRIGDRLELGRVVEADADIATYARRAAELGQPAFLWSALLYRAGRALMSGPVERAAALLAEADTGRGQAAGPPAGGLLTLLFLLRRAEGRLGEMEGEIAESVTRAPERALRRSLLALAALSRGDRSAAARELRALTDGGLGGIRLDLDWLGTAACLSEIAAALDDGPRAALLHDALAPYAGRLVLAGHGAACVGPVSYFLGLTAEASGRLDDAEHRLAEAIAASRALGASTFAARAGRALADVYRKRGEQARASALAAEAREEALRLGLVDLTKELG